MRRTLLLAILATLAAGASPRAQSAVAAILAVDDGERLFPIARLKGTTWEAVPKGLDAPPRDWTRWPAAGGTAPVRLRAAQSPGRCGAPRVFAIDTAPAQARTQIASPGLAVWGGLERAAVTRLAPRSPDWPAVTAAVAPVFERRAHEHGVAPAALSRVTMTMDSAYAASANGTRVYYFEASKRLPDAGDTPAEDPKGVVRVVVAGWLREAAAGLVPAGTKSELNWEPADPRVGVPEPVLTPLGVIRQADRTVWVMQSLMGVRRTFTLYALGASTVRALFSVDAVAC